MENNQQYTIEELNEFILGNIEHYEDFAEYSRYLCRGYTSYRLCAYLLRDLQRVYHWK